MDLFASQESSHCRLFYSLTEAPLGTDALAHSWPSGFMQVCLSYTDPVQDQGERGAGLGCAVLAHQDLVCRPHASHNSPSLEDYPEEGPSFSGDGHDLAHATRSMEPTHLASRQDAVDLSGLSQAVIDTLSLADSHVTLRPRTGYVPKVPITPFRDQDVSLKCCPQRRQTQPLRCCVPSAPCAFTWNAPRASDALSSSLSALEDSRREWLSPSRGLLIGWWMPSPWRTRPNVSCAPWE